MVDKDSKKGHNTILCTAELGTKCMYVEWKNKY